MREEWAARQSGFYVEKLESRKEEPARKDRPKPSLDCFPIFQLSTSEMDRFGGLPAAFPYVENWKAGRKGRGPRRRAMKTVVGRIRLIWLFGLLLAVTGPACRRQTSPSTAGSVVPVESPAPKREPVAQIFSEDVASAVLGDEAFARALEAAARVESDPERRDERLRELCREHARRDAAAAMVGVVRLELDKSDLDIVPELTQLWAEQDLAGARRWLDERAPSAARDELVARLGFVWARGDPRGAADYVLAAIPPGERQTEAAISVLHRWARRDADAALAWANAFPAGPLRERAFQEVLAAASASGASVER